MIIGLAVVLVAFTIYYFLHSLFRDCRRFDNELIIKICDELIQEVQNKSCKAYADEVMQMIQKMNDEIQQHKNLKEE